MIFKKYVVSRNTYDKHPVVVCDNREDAEDIARSFFNTDDPGHYVDEVMYLRSAQTVMRDSLYDMQNGFVAIPTAGGEVVNAEL